MKWGNDLTLRKMYMALCAFIVLLRLVRPDIPMDWTQLLLLAVLGVFALMPVPEKKTASPRKPQPEDDDVTGIPEDPIPEMLMRTIRHEEAKKQEAAPAEPEKQEAAPAKPMKWEDIPDDEEDADEEDTPAWKTGMSSFSKGAFEKLKKLFPDIRMEDLEDGCDDDEVTDEPSDPYSGDGFLAGLDDEDEPAADTPSAEPQTDAEDKAVSKGSARVMAVCEKADSFLPAYDGDEDVSEPDTLTFTQLLIRLKAGTDELCDKHYLGQDTIANELQSLSESGTAREEYAEVALEVYNCLAAGPEAYDAESREALCKTALRVIAYTDGLLG